MTGRSFAVPISVTVALLALGGCTTGQRLESRNLNAVQYAAVAEGLRGSAAARRAELQNCIATVRARSTPAGRRNIAQLMNLPATQDPTPVLCQRTLSAMVSGRLGYDDYQQIRTNKITPKLVRVLQNR